MKIFNMSNDVEKNLWEVLVLDKDELYTLVLEFDGYQLESTTIIYPDGEYEETYTSVVKIPNKFRQVVLDTIYRDTLEKTKRLEEKDE